MHIKEIRAIAKQKNLSTGRKTKVGLIRAIQHQEGNFGCFATAYEGNCDQQQCLWREDCFVLSKK